MQYPGQVSVQINNQMSTLEFSQLLGNYGEFVGAIAIVITLIYLAVQLKQNTATVKANAYQEWAA